MPSVYFPYINIALDLFALVVVAIILFSCFKEFSKKRKGDRYFLILLCAIMVALIADTLSWVGEGNISLIYLTIISNTVATCAGDVVIVCFMGYLKENLYESSRETTVALRTFHILCLLSILFSLGNAYFGYAFAVGNMGHWRHTDNIYMGIGYLFFPLLALIAIIFMAAFAKSSARINRVAFIIYTIFPIAGIILDYAIHSISLTYVGLAISALVIYTGIYLKKQKLIEEQRNALMLSQINPHFVHNTLSTIAAMCDVSPAQAKYLTIDFSRYLRSNFSSLTNKGKIPFEQELSHVECYLKIEQARFRDKLNVIYSIQCKDFEVPPLSVQPIVENAVKHGITKQGAGGTLKISTYDNETHYIVEVIDDGVGFDTESVERHVGLENVQSRIRSMCRGDVSVKSTVGIGTRVTIEIPKRKGNRR